MPRDMPSMPDGPGPSRRKRYGAQQVRQGDVVLRKRWERWLFVVGLAAAAVLALAAGTAGLF